MVVRFYRFEADRALCVVIFFSVIRIWHVKVAVGLKFITKSSHARVRCATWIVPRPITAIERTNDLMKKTVNKLEGKSEVIILQRRNALHNNDIFFGDKKSKTGQYPFSENREIPVCPFL